MSKEVCPFKEYHSAMKSNEILRAGAVAQEVEYLCSKHKALSSNPSTTKGKKNEVLIHAYNRAET
jgi:hypothetical protein